jgi:predicted DNA-binding ribbon-helix-helix protein
MPSIKLTRTTIELDPAVHESVRKLAQRQNLSMARLLGRLVEQGLRATTEPVAPALRSGRFQVIGPAVQDARVTSDQVHKVIDDGGIL